MKRCGVVGWLLGVACVLAAASAVAAEFVKPRLLDSVEAKYPAGGHGDAQVELAVLIGEDGRVTELEVRSGEQPFADAARAAVAAWKFAPAMRDNVPVKSRVLLRVSFVAPAPAVEPAPEVEPAPGSQSVAATPGNPSDSPAAVVVPAAVPAVEITVEGERTEDLAAIHIPRGDTRLIPGAFADPFRVVEILPGVAPVLSGLPYFFVRGAPRAASSLPPSNGSTRSWRVKP